MTLSFVTIVTFRAKILEVIKKLSIFAAEWTVMYLDISEICWRIRFLNMQRLSSTGRKPVAMRVVTLTGIF